MPHDLMRRRTLLQATLGAAATVMLPACSAPVAPAEAWADALGGDRLALLGEVHDNAEHHRLRERALRRALAGGWRPAIVMEQFDLEHQDAIDRARRERPRDARHLIAATGAARGWAWDSYAPLVALALEHDLPLLAGNVSRATASRVIRDGYDAALGAERTAAWNLQRTPDAAWQAAQEREIDLGHCGALPQPMWAAMARAQFARDAALASLLQQHGDRGAVLLAGNGHVRRDIGVPRWIGPAAAARVRAVGFLEAGSPEPAAGQYDHVVRTARAERPDPCEAFKRSRVAPAMT
ncbi:MAG: ChaN family lipoprotein [Burkholderiaceae bacterium]|nr:ChaN family lipoprotein [Burkholderiaceae bacterium]